MRAPCEPTIDPDTRPAWSRDLFKLGPGPIPLLIGARVALAVGMPLVVAAFAGHPVAAVAGGATAMFVSLCDMGTSRATRIAAMAAGWFAIAGGGALGDLLGGTPHANEAVVLLSALLTGWVSGSHPAIATIARFFAVSVACAAGMQFHDPWTLPAALAGGAAAIAMALLFWKLSGIPAADNLMDWRAGVSRAFAGADAGPWFALAFSLTATLALFAASTLGVSRPYWATMVVLMVMRREGVASVQLTIHYIVGTLVGVPVAWALFHLLHGEPAVAVAATLVAAFARIGFALNPALGFTAFTVFLMLIIDLALGGAGLPPHVLGVRLYDVGVGCALALAGTLLAAVAERRALS